MVTFLSDTMTDTNGVLLQDHVPDIGGVWFKRIGGRGNNAEIQGNKAKAILTGFRMYTNDIVPNSAEYDIVADINTIAGGSQLTARFLDVSNHYKFRHNGDEWLLEKIVNGITTVLDSLTEGSPAGEHEWKFEIRDAIKKGYLDGVEKVSTTDNNLPDIGEVGLGIITNDTHDNFIASDPPSVPINETNRDVLLLLGTALMDVAILRENNKDVTLLVDTSRVDSAILQEQDRDMILLVETFQVDNLILGGGPILNPKILPVLGADATIIEVTGAN